MHFKTSSIEEVLQTLVHEMCHLWQHHRGTPSRTGYHNREWAAKMTAIGLQPSHTGKPGGQATGQQMLDYPLPDGPFRQSVRKLLSQDFRLSWHDTRAALAVPGPATGGEGEGDGEGEGPASGKRRKYTCRGCAANAWGKPGLALICGKCMEPMTARGRRVQELERSGAYASPAARAATKGTASSDKATSAGAGTA